METIVYFVRHAPADFSLENYHNRKLSKKGQEGALSVMNALKDIDIDCFISSASPRAVGTIQPLADIKGKDIEIYDEFQELLLRGKDVYLEEEDVEKEIKKVFEIPGYKLSGGDSRKEVEERGLPKFRGILRQYEGKVIVLGIHGIMMTLTLASYNPQFDFEFWRGTSKPDIYKVVFKGELLVSCDRIQL